MERQEQIQQAMELLNEATTLVFNIEGDRWQMAYDVLEALLENLNIENTGATTPQQVAQDTLQGE